MLAETPDERKYDALPFPEADVWGLIMPSGDPLCRNESIAAADLAGLPLYCSEQGWQGDVAQWRKAQNVELAMEGSFRLSYNGAIFVREGLGYLLTFDRLIDTSPESGLTFRPLSPRLETRLHLVWKKSGTFTPIAERFLSRVRESFAGTESAAEGELLVDKSD